jgi:hypothetical protein
MAPTSTLAAACCGRLNEFPLRIPGVPRFALHPRLYAGARIRGLKDDQFSCLLLDLDQPCDCVQVVEHDTVGTDSTLTEV